MVDISEHVPPKCRGDALRLRQVITNLVNNAIKFTERGEVQISATCISEAATHCTIQFAVSDTGIGITTKDQERIVLPFTQADTSTTRMFGGSGLGLAICTELISQMGGRLQIQSELGEGSTFFFSAEFAKADVSPRRQRSDRVERFAVAVY